MVAIRLTRLRARATGPTVRLQRLRAIGATTTPDPGGSETRVRLTRLRAVGGAPLTALEARGGPDQKVQAFTTVTLDGRSSVAATSLSWSQTSGTPVVTLSTPVGTPLGDAYATIYGDTYVGDPMVGGLRTFVAPAVAAGAALVFRLLASDGTNTSADLVTVTVAPWQNWRHNGTSWVAERTYFL